MRESRIRKFELTSVDCTVYHQATVLSPTSWIRAPLFFKILEHADGERRGPVSIWRYLKTRLARALSDAALRTDLARRRSPSACPEKLLKIDPQYWAPPPGQMHHGELPPQRA